jgi:protein-L-isoaspartate(D-aspartate) O-methyltransferase
VRNVPTVPFQGVARRFVFLFAASAAVWTTGPACAGPDPVGAPAGGSAAAPSAPSPSAPAGDPFVEPRNRLVEDLRRHGIRSEKVLAALLRVPRHRFVPADIRSLAYEDRPLPIGFDQTISQPHVVAFMTEVVRLKPGDRVLEIGTGSGYQAAILAELVQEVDTIEIIPELASRAAAVLRDLGYRNVRTRVGDGYLGWPERAPFDAIVVTAAPPEVPMALVEQLAVGGRMVVPVGTGVQELRLITRRADGTTEKSLIPVRFVPMVKPHR